MMNNSQVESDRKQILQAQSKGPLATLVAFFPPFNIPNTHNRASHAVLTLFSLKVCHATV